MNIEKIEINGHYVWVDKDAEIKEGDWFYNSFNDNQPKIQKRNDKKLKCFNENKIIAASPELNLEGIPTYVEWLAEQEYPIDILETSKGCFDDMNLSDRNIFIKGYQAAEKELPTWDDVEKAIEMARILVDSRYEFEVEDILGSSDGTYGIKIKYSEKEIIEQLKQSKQ